MRRFQSFFVQCLVVGSLLIIWQVAVIMFEPEYFPRLDVIASSWHYHWFDGNLQNDLVQTLRRVVISFILAMFIGVLTGILMGRVNRANQIFEPLLLFFLNLPALVTIILCYIWIGLEETAAILAVFINKLPTVIVAMREGARVIDNKLMEVAKVYKLPASRTFFNVFLPQLYPYILAAARNGLALIWKIVLVVELLGRSDGIGFGLHTFFGHFDIASILAYAFSFMMVMFSVDWFVFKPLEKRIQRGRQQ